MERFQNTRQPDWDWWGRLWPTPGETLRQLGVTPDSSLDEIGSGNGYFTLPAARITAPAPVYALDLDQSLLDELTHLADHQQLENVVPIHGDARDLSDHLPEPVDTVLIANMLHGVDDTSEFVKQAFDSLRSGGRVVVVNWRDMPREATTIAGAQRGPPTDLRLSAQETEAVVGDAVDCSLDRRLALPPYHYAMLFEQ